MNNKQLKERIEKAKRRFNISMVLAVAAIGLSHLVLGNSNITMILSIFVMSVFALVLYIDIWNDVLTFKYLAVFLSLGMIYMVTMGISTTFLVSPIYGFSLVVISIVAGFFMTNGFQLNGLK